MEGLGFALKLQVTIHCLTDSGSGHKFAGQRAKGYEVGASLGCVCVGGRGQEDTQGQWVCATEKDP